MAILTVALLVAAEKLKVDIEDPNCNVSLGDPYCSIQAAIELRPRAMQTQNWDEVPDTDDQLEMFYQAHTA